MDYAAIISIHLVRNAIHVDSGLHSLGDRDDMKPAPEGSQPAFELAPPINMRLDLFSIHLDSILLWPNAIGLHGVELAAIAQGERAADVT